MSTETKPRIPGIRDVLCDDREIDVDDAEIAELPAAGETGTGEKTFQIPTTGGAILLILTEEQSRRLCDWLAVGDRSAPPEQSLAKREL